MSDVSRLTHDLRAPLARALTYAKLLEEAPAAEVRELLPRLRQALDDLERRLREAERESEAR